VLASVAGGVIVSSAPAGVPVGYLILTSQGDGTWQDDWDGVVHPTYEAGRAEYECAAKDLDPDDRSKYLKLVALYEVPV
jgi:hypothetical protein